VQGEVKGERERERESERERERERERGRERKKGGSEGMKRSGIRIETCNLTPNCTSHLTGVYAYR
jgi:hypothetical protein